MSRFETNLKTIARNTNSTPAEVHNIARELGLPTEYRADLRRWNLVNRADSNTLVNETLARA